MTTRRVLTATLGLLLLFGTAAADDAATEQEKAILAINQVGGTVWGNPPNTVRLVNVMSANAAMLHVDKLPELTGIYANNGDVADDGLAKVKGLSKLTFLYMPHTKITDKGMANLKGLTKLQGLDLEGTAIGDEGIAHLKGLPALSTLNLQGTKVTPAGVAALRKSLPKILMIRTAAPVTPPNPAAAPKAKDPTPLLVKLPIPEFDITCTATLWQGSFTVKKVTYDKDNKQVVFVLEAVRNLSFQDDGFESIKFYDEDGVDMIQRKNIEFDADPKALKMGEATRARMTVPDADVLKKTTKCAAVASGHFMK